MPTDSHDGRLYRLDPDRTLTTLLEGVTVSNGMGFTPDGKGLYHTDSMKKTITLFDYDDDGADDIAVSNGQILSRFWTAIASSWRSLPCARFSTKRRSQTR